MRLFAAASSDSFGQQGLEASASGLVVIADHEAPVGQLKKAGVVYIADMKKRFTGPTVQMKRFTAVQPRTRMHFGFKITIHQDAIMVFSLNSQIHLRTPDGRVIERFVASGGARTDMWGAWRGKYHGAPGLILDKDNLVAYCDNNKAGYVSFFTNFKPLALTTATKVVELLNPWGETLTKGRGKSNLLQCSIVAPHLKSWPNGTLGPLMQLLAQWSVDERGAANLASSNVTLNLGTAKQDVALEFMRKVKRLKCTKKGQACKTYADSPTTFSRLVKHMMCATSKGKTQCCVAKSLVPTPNNTDAYMVALKMY